jgi:hypothetical protein
MLLLLLACTPASDDTAVWGYPYEYERVYCPADVEIQADDQAEVWACVEPYDDCEDASEDLWSLAAGTVTVSCAPSDDFDYLRVVWGL